MDTQKQPTVQESMSVIKQYLDAGIKKGAYLGIDDMAVLITHYNNVVQFIISNEDVSNTAVQ